MGLFKKITRIIYRLKFYLRIYIIDFLKFHFFKKFIDPHKFKKKIHFSNKFVPNKTTSVKIDILENFLLRKRKVNILEIGTYLGEFTFKLNDYLSKHNVDYKIFTVDPYIDDSFFVDRNYIFKIFNHNLGLVNRTKNINHIKMKSEAAFKFLIKKNYNINLIFIDGSHIYEDVKKDLEFSLYFKKKYETEIFLDDLEFTYDELLKIYDDKKALNNLLEQSKRKDYVRDKVSFHPGTLLAIKELNIKVSKQKFGTLRRII